MTSFLRRQTAETEAQFCLRLELFQDELDRCRPFSISQQREREKKKKPRSTLSKHVPVIWYSQLEIVQICSAIRFKGPLTERGRWNTWLTRRADLITQRRVIYSREQLTPMRANCFYHSRNTVAGRMRKHPVSTVQSEFKYQSAVFPRAVVSKLQAHHCAVQTLYKDGTRTPAASWTLAGA